MNKLKNLPQYLKSKTNQDHKIVTMNGHQYIICMPYVLYRLNGVEWSYSNRYGYTNPWKYLGDVFEDDIKFELFDHQSNKWLDLLADENSYVASIFREDIENLDKKYAGYWEINSDNSKGWIEFDAQKYVTDKISSEIVIDIKNNVAYAKGTTKKYKISEFTNWDYTWMDYDEVKIIANSIATLENFIRYMAEELSAIKFESSYRELYDAVKSGEMSYEEFLTKV